MLGSIQLRGMFCVVAALFMAPAISAAAPQALGLVATKGGVPLICRDGECSAEFSAFCLQEERRTPLSGTLYRLVGSGELRLSGETLTGERMSLNPVRYLKLTSIRDYVSVRLSVLEADIARLGLRRVSVEVGRNVAMAPVPEPGDPNPQTEADLALASGPLRELAGFVVDRDPVRMDAARITNRMVNRLRDGDRPGAAARRELWKEAVAGSADAAPEARGLARNVFRYCNNLMASGQYTRLRQCLAEQHDRFLEYLNQEYWDSIDAGS